MKPYSDYKNILDILKGYNRADTVNMSENEMNKFRHIAGPALMVQKHSPVIVNMWGGLKEIKDLIRGRGLKDTLFDLNNNHKGIEIGNEYPDVNSKSILDYVYKQYIQKMRN